MTVDAQTLREIAERVSEDKLLFIALNAHDNAKARGFSDAEAMRVVIRALAASQEQRRG